MKSRSTGFTLIELMVVLAIIATLLTIALPRYFGSVDRSKEAALKQDLRTMRDALDKYYADNGQYPDALQDLASKKYLRDIPPDPMTDSDSTWIVLPPAFPIKGAVYDVKSGATGQASDGSDYSSW